MLERNLSLCSESLREFRRKTFGGMVMKRVRIFMDHSNFTIGWSKHPSTRGMGVKWKQLPKIVMSELTHRGFINADSDLRGITVYGSVKREGEADIEKFLHFDLDQLPGYTVRISYRQERPCSHVEGYIHHVEKGVDTKIVCDMLALAMRDHYDLAVLVSDDEDLVPSIQCVQDILDRQIIHLGFARGGRETRSAAWGHIPLDDLVGRLKGPRHPGDNCHPRSPPKTPSNDRCRPSANGALQEAMKAAQQKVATSRNAP